VGNQLAAIPVESVSETLRPLPVDPVAGVPPFVVGLSVIRGVATPVVQLGRLISGSDGRAQRYVVVRSGKRPVALAVDGVVGVHALSRETVGELPPLVSGLQEGAVRELGVLDSELLLVLNTGRVVPESVFLALEAARVAS
jgi:purine-binding chemotaxis protein CheW